MRNETELNRMKLKLRLLNEINWHDTIIMLAICMMLVRTDVLGIEQLYSMCLTFYYTPNIQAGKHTERVIKRSVQFNFDRTTMHVHTVTYMLM